MSEVLDLGFGHTLEWTCWKPDRNLNPQYAGIPDVERYGAIIEHPANTETGRCAGTFVFDSPTARAIDPSRPMWTVEQWEPLTLSPSIKCSCGDHGHVRAGKWVPA